MSGSPNFPSRTVDTVSVSRYAVTTHDMGAAPPRSDTIVGDAVSTIVRSRAVGSVPGLIVTKSTLRSVSRRADAPLRAYRCPERAVAGPAWSPRNRGAHSSASTARPSRSTTPASRRAQAPTPARSTP